MSSSAPGDRPVFSHRVRLALESTRGVRPIVADSLLGALLATIAIVDLFSDELSAPYGWRTVVAVASPILMAMAVAVRRRYPDQVMFVIGTVGGVTSAVAPMSFFGALMIMLALYNIAAHGRWTDAVVAAIITFGVLTLLAIQNFQDIGYINASINYLLFGLAFLTGYAMRTRQELAEQLVARAAEEDRRREEQAARAVMEERQRIARELHDIVAHSVSVMVVQAGAARRVVENSPQTAVEAVGRIETTGRSALAEIRRLLGVLRNDHDGAAARLPQPGVGDLADLVGSLRDAGLPVTLSVRGEVGDLAPGIDLTIYRIVQEALTNVLRHAGPVRRVEADVEIDQTEVVVCVTDDGSGAAAGGGSGRGILGMRERVDLHGGTLDAAPRRGGGWRVRATLPRTDRIHLSGVKP